MKTKFTSLILVTSTLLVGCSSMQLPSFLKSNNIEQSSHTQRAYRPNAWAIDATQTPTLRDGPVYFGTKQKTLGHVESVSGSPLVIWIP